MGKVDEYTAGRMQGLLQARDLVRAGGLEELDKEIEFRNMTGINTALTRKELDKACDKIKANDTGYHACDRSGNAA